MKDLQQLSKIEELLKKLRGRLAYKKQCEPFKIFRDVELKLLLDNQPKTIEELAKIKGFPRDGKRVANYGQSIIDIFCKTDEVVDFDVKLGRDGEPVSKTKTVRMSLF